VTCLSRGQIALAASLAPDEAGGHDEVHLAGCLTCRAAVADQRAIRALIRATPAPPLPRDRREAIAAEVAATVGQLPPPRDAGAATEPADVPALAELPVVPPVRARHRSHRIWRGVAAAALAGAAAIAIARGPRARSADPAVAPAVAPAIAPADAPRFDLAAVPASPEAVAPAVRGVAHEPAPAPPPPAIARAHGAADFTRGEVADRDVLALRGGSVTLDARDAREIAVTARGTTVRVDDAKVRVVAHRGAIASVTVFAGSAEVTTGGVRTVIEAGMVWVPEAVGPEAALDEFRAGWTALRAGEHGPAIAAFDRATDPVVAEDAAYWAAVASERAGDRGAAARRFAAFAARFPDSPHAEAAHRALARLAP
jgi:hypothetical protein